MESWVERVVLWDTAVLSVLTNVLGRQNNLCMLKCCILCIVHILCILQKTTVLWQYAISNIAIDWQRTSIASEWQKASISKKYWAEFIGCRGVLHSVKVLTAFTSPQSPMWLSMDRGGVCEWPFWGWHTGWLLSVPLGYGHLARPGDLEDNWAFSRRCELSLLGLHLLHESYSDFMSLSVFCFFHWHAPSLDLAQISVTYWVCVY